MILGCDVHGGYYARSPINFKRVYQSGRRFVIAKHTQGNDPHKDDGTFWTSVEHAKAAGLIVGRYHYAYNLPDHPDHPGRGPIEEAERSWQKARGFGTKSGELPPFIDAEHLSPNEWPSWGCSPKQVSEWLRVHADATAQRWGRAPIIYTYPAWWVYLEDHADTSWAAQYGLWIASDGALNLEAPGETQMPRALTAGMGRLRVKTWGERWLFWQYGFDGSKMTVPGIDAVPVDRDCFNGTLDELRALAMLPSMSETTLEVEVPEMRPSPHEAQVIHPKVPLGRPGLDDE